MLEVVVVMCSEEDLDLLCEEAKEFPGGFCGHEMLGDRNLGVGEVKCCVAVQLDGTDAEVGAAQVDGQVQALCA